MAKKTYLLLILAFIFTSISFSTAEAISCIILDSGTSQCRGALFFPDAEMHRIVNEYAEAHPGKAYMAYCQSNGIPAVVEARTACDCKIDTPAPGGCELNKECGVCGNPLAKCSSEPAPKCGDGEINQAWEQCEFDSQCNDGNLKTLDSCESCICKHEELCQDECSFGETKCVGNQVYRCGDFDTDSCLEWGFKTDCTYYIEEPVFECEYGSSVQYKKVKEGICKDLPGNHDSCDSKTTETKVSSEYCGDSSCTQGEQCIGDDIFFIKKCNGACNQNTGKCTYGSEDRTKIDECGQDNCISHTNLDPFVFEYVEDNSGCKQNGAVYCGYDTQVFDICIGDTVIQPYCNGKDHAIQEFDCSSLTGCYDYTFTQCVKCDDDEGNCVVKDCTMTGQEFRDYTCGSGKCQYTKDMHDIDKDGTDDRCDDCIDVDKDGACDFEDDNCIGVYNPSQIDTDKDGKGNDCDNDRDGDGYAAGYDCNDWNPRVHPFAIEIENNGVDDDCSSDTADMVADTPHQIFYVDTSMSDIVKAGNSYTFVVSVTNMAEGSVKDVKLSASLPELQVKESRDIGKLKKGATVSRVFTFNIPKDTEGYKYLRITVSNDQYKRVIYKEIEIVTNE